jgi:RNA polymerase sigma-70 factor (ECF subfamily)
MSSFLPHQSLRSDDPCTPAVEAVTPEQDEADRRLRDRARAPQLRALDIERLPDHRERLFRAAYAMCGSRENAEDLVQDTYVRVLQRPRFLRHGDDLGYLLRAMRNTWINSYKQRQRRPRTVEFDESVDFVIDPEADPGVTVTGVQAIYAAVYELSPQLRDTLIAVDILGLSYKQAAHALHTRQGTIMSRLFRARNKVAERLEQAEAYESAERAH